MLKIRISRYMQLYLPNSLFTKLFRYFSALFMGTVMVMCIYAADIWPYTVSLLQKINYGNTSISSEDSYVLFMRGSLTFLMSMYFTRREDRSR